MSNPTETAADLDLAHEKAQAAFQRKDLGAYMSLFSPDLRYRQPDGKVIGRDQLARDVRAQFSKLSASSSTYNREQFELANGKAIEVVRGTASACVTVFLFLHRTWDISRRGRYVWRMDDGQWVIEEVEVLEETVQSRGWSCGNLPTLSHSQSSRRW